MAIDIGDQVIEIVRGVVGQAYRAWPQKTIKAPYAVVSLIGRSVELVDHDGSEVRVRLTYSIGVLASKPSEAESLALEVADAMAVYNFHTTGFSGTWEDPSGFYRADVTLDGAVDRRGDTFK